jgi:hypothetical protein
MSFHLNDRDAFGEWEAFSGKMEELFPFWPTGTWGFSNGELAASG